MSEDLKSENEAVIDFVKESYGAELLDGVTAESVAVVPTGMSVRRIGEVLDHCQEQPRRRTGTIKLEDEASFLAWCNRVSDMNKSVIYANDQALTAVVNDSASAESEHAPGWGDFRGHYELARSNELQQWLCTNSWMNQKTFAKFLEDRILDVLLPADAGEKATAIAAALGVPIAGPKELMVLSRGLSLRVNAKMTDVVNLSTGESEFSYAEEHTNAKGKPMKVPGAFVVGIPVFERGESYKMPVRLRYMVGEDKKVHWKVELLRLQESVDAALNEMVERVAAGTKLPVFRGYPPIGAR